MKLFGLFIGFACLLSSCSHKIVPNVDKTYVFKGKDGRRILTNLSSSDCTDKSIFPYYYLTGLQKYYFEILGGESCCYSSHNLSACNSANFRKAKSNHAGRIQVGDFTFKPGEDKQYGGYCNQRDACLNDTLLENFGRNTSIFIEGDNAEIVPLLDTIYFPKIFRFTNIDSCCFSKTISRSKGFEVRYEIDSINPYPLFVDVSWSWNAGFDKMEIPKKQIITNQFLLDETGVLVLTEAMFMDIPKNANNVLIGFWRGNCLRDEQGLFFNVLSKSYFSVNLID